MKLLLRLIFALGLLGAILLADQAKAWDRSSRQELMAKLMWEFAKYDTILTSTIGPEGKTEAEENRRFRKFVDLVIPKIKAQPQNHAIIYQNILKLQHLTAAEVPAFFAIWFDELLNRAFAIRAKGIFDPSIPLEDVRWMQNINRLNRALSVVLFTYQLEDSGAEENLAFNKMLKYLLADEHLFKNDLLSISQVHLALSTIRWSQDDVQKKYQGLVKEVVWRHPNRAVRLMGVNHMLYHLKDYDATLDALWRSYRWQKEFWFDFDQQPAFVYDLLAYHINLSASASGLAINKRVAYHLWHFLLPGLMLPRWWAPEDWPMEELGQGHFNILTSLADHENPLQLDFAAWVDGEAILPAVLNARTTTALAPELPLDPARWERHLQVLKIFPERSIFRWHIAGDLISLLYNSSTQTASNTTREDLRTVLDIFNEGLHNQLRQRNVMHLKGKITKVLHFILLQYPAWQEFCAQQNITIPDTLPIEALGVWQKQIHPLIKSGQVQLAPELRTWYEFLTDTPENTQKLFEQILGLRPLYRFMVENEQGAFFLKAVSEFMDAEKVLTDVDRRKLLATLDTAITTATSEAQTEGELNSALAFKKVAYSTPTYLTELGHQLNILWFPKEIIIGPGRNSPYLLPQELKTVLDLLRPYYHTLLPLFSAVDRRNSVPLDAANWESNFTQMILPNIFTSRATFLAELTTFIRLGQLATPHALSTDELITILGAIEPLFNRTKNRSGQKSYTFNLSSYLVQHLDDDELSALVQRLGQMQVPQKSVQQYWSAFEMSLINAILTERSTKHPQHDLFLLRFLALAQDTSKPVANRLEALWHIFYLKQNADPGQINPQLDYVVREAIKYLQDATAIDNFLAEVKATPTITLYEFTSLLTPAFMHFSKENGRTFVGTIVAKILQHAEDDLSILPGSFLDHPPKGIDRQLLTLETLATVFLLNKFNLHSLVQLVTFALTSDLRFGRHEKIRTSELFVLAVVRKFMPLLKKASDRQTILTSIRPLLKHPNRIMRLYAQTAYWSDTSLAIGNGDRSSWQTELDQFISSIYLPQDTDLRLRIKLMPLHDLFLIRSDFRQNTVFLMETILKQIVQTQAQVNVRTMARLGSVMGGALYTDIDSSVSSRSERFITAKNEIVRVLQERLNQEKINGREIVFLQGLLYDFIPHRFHIGEKENILREHLKSKRPTIVLHAIKEVINRKLSKLYDHIIPLLDNTNYLSSLITFRPEDKPNKVAHNVYLLSLLFHIKKMHIKELLAPHGIQMMIKEMLPLIPGHADVDLRYLDLDPIQTDTSLIVELPPRTEFISYLKEKFAQRDYTNAHYLLAMLILEFGKEGLPVLDNEQLIELLTAYFYQITHDYHDLYVNGPQDYRALMKSSFVVNYLSKFERGAQLNYLQAILEHAQKLVQEDPAQAALAFNFYYLGEQLILAQPIGDADRKAYHDQIQQITNIYINLPEPLISWPAGQALQIFVLGLFDHQLLGLDQPQWNALKDFLRRDGRQIILQGQYAKLTPEDAAYLAISPH
ncbi:MAG: hypothetical protein J6Y94_01735, partial [Bacteriovoracaceae bacterium]|nr:hypothetical protein [Bacteriovoracaceae bacterium]